MSNKFESKMRERYQQQTRQHQPPPKSDPKKPKDDKLGEYIDYEEID